MATPMKVPKLSVGRPQISTSSKKRRKRTSQVAINRSRIVIGDQIERWNSLKGEIGVKTNSEVAKVLLDRYYGPLAGGRTEPLPGTSNVETASRKKLLLPSCTSTPAAPYRLQLLKEQPHESSAESSISGVEPIATSSRASSSGSPKQHSPKKKVPAGYSTSFMDPFELSIDIHEDSNSECEIDEDEDYEPSFDIFIGPVNENISEVSFAEDLFPEEIEDVEESEIEGVIQVQTPDEAAKLSEEQMFLCSHESLIALSKMSVKDSCRTCKKPLSFHEKTRGSAVYFKWVCENGHTDFSWCSQTLLRGGVHSGDLMVSAAVLFSGNNFQKILLLAKFLNLAMVSQSSYTRYQTTYLVPAVETFWNGHIENILERKRGGDIVIVGDGRMDSPGHCAQYCTYTAMDNSTKEILSVVTVDKRETGKSSIRMEKEAFVRTLNNLEKEDVTVGEVVTDAHTSIAAYLRNECPQIKHSFDIWHVAKNLAKKIMKAGQQKHCSDLKGWCRHIVNHFYHTCDTAQDVEEFTGIWFGLLHHIVDEHEWSFGCGTSITKCVHGPLTEPREVKWLSKGSPAHDALRQIVADKRFLKQIPYFLNARSTAELEGFNNLILMYAGKRFSYVPPVYRARNLIAAIDHNSHLERLAIKNKDGTERVHKIFNKKSSRWLVRPVKEQKKYEYKKALLEIVLRLRMEDKKSMYQPVIMKADDPRRISSTISQVAPPPTEQLKQEQMSRFQK